MTANYAPASPDYRINGYEAATERTEEDFFSVTLSDHAFLPPTAHHTADGRDSYVLLPTAPRTPRSIS